MISEETATSAGLVGEAFPALRAGNPRKASSSLQPYPFSLYLLFRLSRGRLGLRVGATMQPCGTERPGSGLPCITAHGEPRSRSFPASCEPPLCTRRRCEIVEMGVPPGNHPAVPRDLDLRRTCRYVAKFPATSSPRQARDRRDKRDPRTPGRTAVSAVAPGGSCVMPARAAPRHRTPIFSRLAPDTPTIFGATPHTIRRHRWWATLHQNRIFS
jgi:hypothetical protein